MTKKLRKYVFEEDDPRDELVERLIEYKQFKEAASNLKEKESERGEIFMKPPSDLSAYAQQTKQEVTDIGVTIFDMLGAYHKLLRRKKLKRPLATKISHKEISIEGRMAEVLTDLTKSKKKISFFAFFKSNDKQYIVVTFLAMLELMKRKEVFVEQEGNFDEIYLEARKEALRMGVSKHKGILESLLFAAGDEGLSLVQICETMEISTEEAQCLIESLREEYENDIYRGITLIALAETYQLGTKREYATFLRKLAETPGPSTISQAGLETLAIIAYKQPITRMEIEEIRGVKTERPLHTLMSRGLIKEAGRVEGTGRAILYSTTKEFLDYFGLNDLHELPKLEEEDKKDTLQEESDLFFSSFEEQIE